MDELRNKKILIVDDEPQLLRLVSDALYRHGYYNLFTARDGASALELTREQRPALFLLDVNLPDMDGFSLLEKLRDFSGAPVIFLTARGEGCDRIRGLGLGADDYIVKPFLTEELVLRSSALLRRVYTVKTESPVFVLSGVTVKLDSASVLRDGRELPLTAKEYILLKKLWDNRGRIVTGDALCLAAWGEDYYGLENTLMVHIRRLRKKIEADPSSPRHLLTVKGLGYKLVAGDE